MNNLSSTEEWTKKTTIKTIAVFLFRIIALLGIMAVIVWIQKGGEFVPTFRQNLSNYAYITFCTILLIMILYLYLFFENREILADVKKINLIFCVLDICLILSNVFGVYMDIYARPVALIALLIFMLIGRKEAIFMNTLFAILVFILDHFADNEITDKSVYSSLILTFVAGMFAIFFERRIKTRFQVFIVGIAIVVPEEIIIGLLETASLAGGGAVGAELFTRANIRIVLTKMGYGLLGGVLSAALFLVLLPIFEVIFNCLTCFRLRELTSGDAKLLKKLKEEAPGTYNHSAVVAQLAEACAENLGENVDYARAAGFYHDMGKLHQPEYFTENQGDYNLHDELTPELSADIIRSHTQDGYDLIRANHLPQFLADVALQHHGTLPIRYFYAKALKMSGGDLNIEDFSYQGPKPRTKIAAIIMIVDAAEAASRSLDKRTPESVELIVRQIIEERMDLDQFSDCNITMADLTEIRRTIVATLTGVYHHRIKYPSIRFKRAENGKTRGENE